ncbi:9596_t:CDS:2, partial [Dentiscutata heterogama]
YSYDDYTLYNEPLTPTLETNTSPLSSTIEINTSSPTSVSEPNASTLETNTTSSSISETDIILSTKPSPLWKHFFFNPVNHNDIQDLMPTTETWNKIKEIITLMEPLEKATKLLSASSYPTIADVRFVFSSIQEYLQDYIDNDTFSQYLLASSINEKIS